MTDPKPIPLTAHMRAVADSVAAWLRESEALHPIRTVDQARVDLGDEDASESCGSPSPWSNQTCDQRKGHDGPHWAEASGESPWHREDAS
ncbi:hypothetical protein ACIRON_02975 [Nocardioides sp. NPDC101246]|uniref:hypothetical protein n=1 Tax=Nocardioides sp. NPDC101246 TaxID=3364336 RepID=UPI0037FD8F21